MDETKVFELKVEMKGALISCVNVVNNEGEKFGYVNNFGAVPGLGMDRKFEAKLFDSDCTLEGTRRYKKLSSALGWLVSQIICG